MTRLWSGDLAWRTRTASDLHRATDAGGASTEEKTRALKGKNIGITGPGSGTEALVNYLFGLVDMDAKTDATLVNLGAVSSAALGALKAGRVDALAFFQPIGQQAEAAGVGTIYISPAAGDVPTMTGALHGIAFTRAGVLKDKAKEVESFQNAIDRSLEFIAGEESKVRELLGEYLDGTPAKALDSLVPILRKESPSSAAVDQKAYDIARTFHVDSGLVEKAPSYDEIVPKAFR